MNERSPARFAPSIVERTLRDEHDVAMALASLLGEDPGGEKGVIHVAACFRGVDGLLHVLKIGPAAPRSASDFFMLQATRARADVIVTSAENLRSEPSLRHALAGPHREALHAYRRACLGGDPEPTLVVLTRSGQLPRDHPAFYERVRVRVFAPEGVAPLLARRLPDSLAVEPWSGSVRDAVSQLRAEGRNTISIEAGPSTVRALYEPETMVDEVCMSIYEGGEVGEAAQGPALLADASLFAGLTRASGDVLVDEPSGRFRFMRWLRRT